MLDVAEASATTGRRGVTRELRGWGRRAPSHAEVIRADSADDVGEVLGDSPSLLARGAGLSYGDAAQNGGGRVLDMTGLDEIVAVDVPRRLVTVQAGATLVAVLDRLAAHDLTLPVVPGTRHVTVGGAIASDIHGKNHHRDGSFAHHVEDFTLCTPAGERLTVSGQDDAELFLATCGGMGLTGVITEATLRVESAGAGWVAADTDRTDTLEETLGVLEGVERHRYSVAWLDLLAPGRRYGRAVISRADAWPEEVGVRVRHRRGSHVPSPLAISARSRLDVPRLPRSPLHPAAVRAFNELRWRASPRRERERPLARAPYFFPLDGLGQWNRLYGESGLVQYQFVVPDGQEPALMRALDLLRERRLPVYLAVLKRMGAASGGPLSFPLTGWTLAVDLPGGAPGLWPALDQLDEIVVAARGRVYLAKDVRMRSQTLAAMYPALDDLRLARARVDPEGVLRSDLAARLGLLAS